MNTKFLTLCAALISFAAMAQPMQRNVITTNPVVAAGANVTISAAGGTVTISSTGGSGGGQPPSTTLSNITSQTATAINLGGGTNLPGTSISTPITTNGWSHFFIGDSLMTSSNPVSGYGNGFPNDWPSHLLSLPGFVCHNFVSNYAYNGQLAEYNLINFSNGLLAPLNPPSNSILYVAGGNNDISAGGLTAAQIITVLSNTYMLGEHLGYYVVALTENASAFTTPELTTWTNVQAWVRTNGITQKVVDEAAIITNLSTQTADGCCHPSAYWNGVIAQAVWTNLPFVSGTLNTYNLLPVQSPPFTNVGRFDYIGADQSNVTIGADLDVYSNIFPRGNIFAEGSVYANGSSITNALDYAPTWFASTDANYAPIYALYGGFTNRGNSGISGTGMFWIVNTNCGVLGSSVTGGANCDLLLLGDDTLYMSGSNGYPGSCFYINPQNGIYMGNAYSGQYKSSTPLTQGSVLFDAPVYYSANAPLYITNQGSFIAGNGASLTNLNFSALLAGTNIWTGTNSFATNVNIAGNVLIGQSATIGASNSAQSSLMAAQNGIVLTPGGTGTTNNGSLYVTNNLVVSNTTTVSNLLAFGNLQMQSGSSNTLSTNWNHYVTNLYIGAGTNDVPYTNYIGTAYAEYFVDIVLNLSCRTNGGQPAVYFVHRGWVVTNGSGGSGTVITNTESAGTTLGSCSGSSLNPSAYTEPGFGVGGISTGTNSLWGTLEVTISTP